MLPNCDFCMKKFLCQICCFLDEKVLVSDLLPSYLLVIEIRVWFV